MTKRRSSEILADKTQKLNLNFFHRLWKMFWNRGEFETGGKCIIGSGGWMVDGCPY